MKMPSLSAIPIVDHPNIGLRSRMLIILMLAAIPGLVVAVFLTVHQLREETRQIEQSVTRLAKIGAAEHQSVIANARVILKSVVEAQRIADVADVKDADCQTYLSGWTEQLGYFTSLTLFDPSGRVACTNFNGELPYSAGSEGWFSRVRSAREFVLSDYQVGQNGTPLLVAALPIENDQRKLIGVVALGISLDWLDFLTATIDLPNDATISVLGPDGIILSHNDGTTNVSDPDLTRPSNDVRLQINDSKAGTLRGRDQSGVMRVYGFNPTSTGGVTVVVGLPQFMEYFEWSSALFETLLSPIAVLLMTLAAAAWASESLVVRHVRSLIATAGEIASGNLQARSEVDYNEHELGELAQVLDEMANEIEEQQAELRAKHDDNVLIAQEMQHRIGNTLTLARIIATQTLKHSASHEDFVETFGHRLQALSVSNQKLLQGNWTSAALDQVIVETLKIHLREPSSCVDLQGPKIELGPRAILAITLSVHELCTNSIKYGAFSTSRGQVSLHWSVEHKAAERWLTMTWQETGIPTRGAPTTKGFGSRLISSMIEGNLRGRVQRVFTANGLVCELSFPLGKKVSVDTVAENIA